jgi:predicted nucleic acid-binding protein
MIYDFEDGMQYYSAVKAGCSIIVTEDKDDFYFSNLTVNSCEELLKTIL